MNAIDRGRSFARIRSPGWLLRLDGHRLANAKPGVA